MKIVLLEDMKGLGVRGDVCTVSGGYAMNFLIPGKKAAAYTDNTGKEAAIRKAEDDSRRSAQKEKDDTMFSRIPEHLTVSAAANEQGTLFSAVTAATLVKRLEEDGITVPETCFENITVKEVGEHTVTAHHDGDEKTLTLTVRAENTETGV